MKMFRKRRCKTETGEINLAEGVLLRMEDVRAEEPRILTLLLKSFLVYLIVMGSIGCFLTTLNIQCAWWVIHLGVALGAAFCSLLYYNKLCQNIGYILLFFVMLALAVWLHKYISSGCFAVANELFVKAAYFFDSSALRSYTELVRDRSLTIPIAMCYVGWVACIMMNVLISRRMQYMVVILLCLGILFTPLYLEREPDVLYMVMLLGGMVASFIIRGNGHYRLSMKNQCYVCRKKNRQISYVYAGKTVGSLLIIVVAVSFIIIQLLGVVIPKDKYPQTRAASKMKAGTMDAMENFTLLGIMGLFNHYPNTGGLTGGTLGGVSAIRLDYQTDLTVTYAPYSLNRLYLKSFTGATYLPVSNRWSRLTDIWGTPVAEQVEATQMRYAANYERGADQTAKGRMRITNVAAANGMYLPYFSTDVGKTVPVGHTEEYDYYPPLQVPPPGLSYEPLKDVSEKMSEEMSEKEPRELSWSEAEGFSWEYLVVPDKNLETITEFCEKAGLKYGDTDTIVRQLTAYYQENIPYTIRPGATPYRQDFVNYFLTKNQRGYCAHFASAATLIFRYLGIPARYVEGYVIDSANISEDGKILPEESYDDYYDGYSALGTTAVVSVDVSDANAHAWVEIYDFDRGWYPVEVTPFSLASEDMDGGLWQRLFNFLLSDAGMDGAQQAGDTNQGSTDMGMRGDGLASIARLVTKVLAILGIAAILLYAGRKLAMLLLRHYHYRHASCNDKLVMRYHAYIRRLARRQKTLPEQLNYREQVQWLASHNFWRIEKRDQDRAVAILEQAGFSSRQITEDELRWTLALFD